MFKILKEIKKGDYLYALVPDHPNATKNGYVLYHRVVVENFLGRLLTKDEIVHHKDGNKKNNNIDNLEVMSQSEHTFLHQKEKGRCIVELICPECNSKFSREKRNTHLTKSRGTKQTFCSRRCSGKYHSNKKRY